MKRSAGFTLMEMTMVLLIIGIIAFMTIRMIPKMGLQGDLQNRQIEFANAETMFINWLINDSKRAIKIPPHVEEAADTYTYTSMDISYSPDNTSITNFRMMDSSEKAWGYMASPDLAADACALSPQYPIILTEYFSAASGDNEVTTNVAILLYSNDPNFLAVYTDLDAGSASASPKFDVWWYRRNETYTFADRDMLMRVITFPELRKMLNCPSSSEATPFGTTVRLRSANAGEPYADNHQIQFFPRSELGNVSYCFERGTLSSGFTLTGANFVLNCSTSNSWHNPASADSIYLSAATVPTTTSNLQYFKAYARVEQSDDMLEDNAVYSQEFAIVINQ